MPPPPRTLLERHGRRMARFRWLVIPAWVALLVVAAMLSGHLGDVISSETTLPGSEGQRGIDLIRANYSHGEETSEVQPVFRNPRLTVDDADYREAVTASLDRAAALVPGTRVVSYYSTGGRDLVGQGGHMTFATLSMPIPEDQAEETVPAIREALGTPKGFAPTLVGGEAADGRDLGPIVEDDLVRAEMIVVPAALLVLLIFFGSLVSALVPLVMAAAAILLSFAGTVIVGQGMSIAEQVTNIITLVGVALGVDYSLLIVSRFREELASGADRVTAIGTTMATAGRAVLLAGVTVATGLAVLVALPVPFIQSMGIGGMLVPISAVLAGLTLLPAVLAALGPRVDSLRVYPRRWRLRAGAIWGPLSRAVTGWAVPVAGIVLVALVALASQFGGMGIHPDSLADAPDVESVQAARLVRAELGGAAAPNVYVIDTGRAGGVYDAATLTTLSDAAADLRARGDLVSGVTWPSTTDPGRFREEAGGLVDATGRYALMNVAPAGDPMSASARGLTSLMDRQEPAIEAALPGADVVLTGEPATTNDFVDAMYGPFPWLVAAVLLLTLVGLMRAFRSWLVPLLAVVMSGVSLLASYGLLYLVFQKGIGGGLVGFDGEARGIAFWVPIFVFAFLFGISMDYQVFLLERVRELRDGGLSNRHAVQLGLQSTGRVIVTAALIMVVAFSGFAAGRDVELKQFGVALASAVAIDALLIRLLIVPAAMRLAGERNWTMPRRLARTLLVRPRPTIGETSR